MARRTGEAGFTLVEMLVALAILGIALVALLNAVGENVRAAGSIRQSLLAGIVAENRMVETIAIPDGQQAGTDSDEADLAGQKWVWRREILPTLDPTMQRIEITVMPQGQETPAARLTAFRAKP